MPGCSIPPLDSHLLRLVADVVPCLQPSPPVRWATLWTLSPPSYTTISICVQLLHNPTLDLLLNP